MPYLPKVRSEHIDIFSPQLYSRGREAEPELMETPCTGRLRARARARAKDRDRARAH